MSSEKDLPRIQDELKNELTAENHHLRKTETNEKVVLPDKCQIEAEKTHQKFIEGIETFNAESLKSVKTEEKVVLPTKQDIENEKKGNQ
ncbi:uncharacterized protein B4U79_14377 [Dinothrombium tinctorium]|uniref:Thymosin beta n=1 Tax=Dinothrombium tinctorium TaxID=1965070 RepID=A0A3S3RSG7_9ACAR|nr:uncharacterized protein B4U79_11197 [Dinothrombium tinctorium]RWS10904.1 uncharacterized protein B4U79_13234 [Dinothrombium tinctorium]RWS10909.1 uncharacterized protein B4U79_14377 [Dinothrombium tinctorium]